MKKSIISLLIIASLAVSIFVIQAGAASDGSNVVFQTGNINVYINNEAVELKEAPCIIDGRTMVPFRALAEALDCSVEWIPGIEQIIVTSNSDESLKLIYQIGNTAIYRKTDNVDQFVFRMDTSPVLSEKGNTLLPARYVAEFLGYSVNWADKYDAAVIYPDMGVAKQEAIKEKVYSLLSPITPDASIDDVTTDEERFAKDIYEALNTYLQRTGERKLNWSEDLKIVCDFRAFERSLTGEWLSVNNVSYHYAHDRQLLYNKTCGKYYIPETEFCFTAGKSGERLIQQVRYDEDAWAILKNSKYSNVAVSAYKQAGGNYQAMLILSGDGFITK